MTLALLAALSLFLAEAPARAQKAADCAALKAQAKRELQAQYRFNESRAIAVRVIGSMTPAENAELADLAARFNAIAHDTPEHQNERFALHKRSRRIVRAATARAGYRLRNPEEPSPYDAELGEWLSLDRSTTYGVEVRALLVMADFRPHVTLWLRRLDPAHNPRSIVTLGVMPEERGDYVSWMAKDRRVSGTVDEFLAGGLPASCR